MERIWYKKMKMKTFTYKVNVDVEPLKRKLSQVQRLEKELDEVAAGLVTAIQELSEMSLPFSLDPVEEQHNTAGAVTEYEGL